MVKKLIHKWTLVEEGKKFLIAILTIAFVGMGSTVIMGMVAAQRQDDQIKALELCSADLKSRVVELEKRQAETITKSDLKDFEVRQEKMIKLMIEIKNTGNEIDKSTKEITKSL
jgi:hypothetical protein